MWQYRIEEIVGRGKLGNATPFKNNTELLTIAALGAEGWELVNAVPMMSAGTTTAIRLYFKRFQERQLSE